LAIITSREDDFSNIVSIPQSSDQFGSVPWKSQRLSLKDATWEVFRPEVERLLKDLESHDLNLFLFPIDAPLSSFFAFTPVDETGLIPLEDYRVGPFI
jgi:hypothetical protein